MGYIGPLSQYIWIWRWGYDDIVSAKTPWIGVRAVCEVGFLAENHENDSIAQDRMERDLYAERV